jgi:hypothetical protein
LRRGLDGPLERVLAVVRGLAFWAAIVVPLSYLPVLSLVDGQRRLLAIAGLVAVNVCCLLVGHDYSP